MQKPAQSENPAREGDDRASEKRRYEPPRLVEYGTVAKITQGTGITLNGDGGQMMMIS
jgi:hypothetical protein